MDDRETRETDRLPSAPNSERGPDSRRHRGLMETVDSNDLPLAITNGNEESNLALMAPPTLLNSAREKGQKPRTAGRPHRAGSGM